jgi:hypothetical protein
VIVLQPHEDHLHRISAIIFALTPFAEGRRFAQSVGDRFSNTLSDSTLVIEARTVTRDPQHHRLSGRKDLLPGQEACLPPEFRKGGCVKCSEPDPHPGCRAQMEMGAIEIMEGSAAFHPAGILAGIVEVGRIHGGRTGMTRRHSQLTQFSSGDAFEPGWANDKKVVRAVWTIRRR